MDTDSTTSAADPTGFFRDLDTDQRFRRDKGIGRIFHPGTISYRETVPENSLHIIVDGDQVSAHIDRFSPLGLAVDGSSRYPLWRIVLHNLAGMAKDAMRLLGTGRGADRRAPSCTWVELNEELTADLARARATGASGNAVVDRLRQGRSSSGGDGVRRAPFNVVDQAIVLLDSMAEPWSVQMEARVQGRLDEARLRSAVGSALRRHPMARARRVASPAVRSRDHWEFPREPDVDPVGVVECPDDAALASARAQLYSQQLPLAISPPWRLRVARHPDGDVLMLHVHHAASDGYGALRILRSVARAYAGDPDDLPESDFLADRSLAGQLAGADLSTRLHRYLALVERLRDLVVAPARIAPDQAHAAPGYGFLHEHLGREDTTRIVELPHAGSVNDVLVAALHLAVDAWNADHASGCRRISVLVPANLRPPRLREEAVGNFSLPARVSTSPRHRVSPSATLAAVTRQTSRKKRRGMGTALLEILGRTWLVPLGAKRAAITLLPAATRRFTDTAILSNLGSVDDPPSFGPRDGDVATMCFSAPARMPLGLSLGAVTVGGRLHLSYRYRHPQFGPDAARRFAQCYRVQLHRIAGALAGTHDAGP